jgi:hypothetical protein
MASDNQALLLQVSADVRGLQKAMDRANGIVDAGARSWERSAKRGATAVERALGGVRLPPRIAREWEDLGASIGRSLRGASTAAGYALGAISAYSIKLAADAAEIDSAFDVAFKNAAKSAREFSEVLSGEVGRDAVETRQAMTRLQLVLTGTGVAAEQAATMVKTLARVGIDAGSLFNTSDAEAFQKIISGLSGEAEPLKAFGVVINEAAVKAELLRLGFKGNATEASEAAKSIARANLIIKGLAVAQGDATRTAGSAANQTRALRAEFNKAARELGLRQDHARRNRSAARLQRPAGRGANRWPRRPWLDRGRRPHRWFAGQPRQGHQTREGHADCDPRHRRRQRGRRREWASGCWRRSR